MADKLKDKDLFQSIFESSTQGILVVDSGVILKANHSCENTFGYDPGELIDKKIETLIPKKFKENHSVYKNIYSKGAKTISTQREKDLFGLKKNGLQFPLEISLSPAAISGQQVVIAFVTEIKETNDTIYESNRKYNTLINNLPGFVYRSKNDKDWSMYYVSKGCFSITGYYPNEFMDGHIQYGQIILEKEQKYVWNALQESISKKKPYNIQYGIRSRNGNIKYVWEQGEGIFDKNGKLKALEGFITDITEQKKVEQELRTNELRNKAMLQAIPDFIFVLNRQGVYLDLHASDASKLILPKDELIGKSIYDVLPKELCEKIILNFEKSEKTGKPQTLEYILPINDKIRYFEARIVAKENGNFLTIIKDITHIKQTEIAIKESEERFRLAMLATHDGFYDFDLKNKTGWYNQTYIDLFAPKFGKKWWENNIHSTDNENVIEEFNKTLAGNSNHWTSEYRLKSKNGSYVYVEDNGHIVRNEQGKAIRMLGAVADISERKKAEQILKESEEKLRNHAVELEEKVQERTKEVMATVQQLVESNLNLEDQIQITKAAESRAIASQEMFSAIAQNFPKGIILVVNTDFEIEYIEGEELERMRLKESVFPGISIDDISVFSRERKIRLKQDIRKTLAGEHLSFEIEFENNAYALNTTPLFDESKKINQALLVYSNISDQKQVELEILNALKKEQELNELKSRFISLASHEFRTPLSAILSSATLIEKQNAPGKEDKREKYVNKIKNNVRNLVVILNDFLSLSKLEEGKMSMQPEYFELIDFSKSLIEEIETSKKEGQVITIMNDDPFIEVNLDPKLISHILLNLVSNAIKYSPKNIEITLTITRNGERIFMEVKDQGIGIPLEEQNNLFDRFFRAGNASNIQGTGLGLHIVKQYTELIGGTISFKSKLSEGSTFSVELPINQTKDEKSIID